MYLSSEPTSNYGVEKIIMVYIFVNRKGGYGKAPKES